MKNNFLPAFVWPLLSIICLLAIMAGLKKILNRTRWGSSRVNKIFYGTMALVLTWGVLLTLLARSGFFADFSKLPPRPVFALLLPLPLVLIFSFSKAGTELIRLVPPQWLVAMQAFRIFVEIFLWIAFLSERIPIQMTFEGGNLDIVTGLIALPVAFYIAKNKGNAGKLILIFNCIGILLLLNILVIAVLSMPTPFRHFMNEPANTAVANFPFIYLPGILVPIAYSLHILSLRQLFLNRNLSVVQTN